MSKIDFLLHFLNEWLMQSYLLSKRIFLSSKRPFYGIGGKKWAINRIACAAVTKTWSHSIYDQSFHIRTLFKHRTHSHVCVTLVLNYRNCTSTLSWIICSLCSVCFIRRVLFYSFHLNWASLHVIDQQNGWQFWFETNSDIKSHVNYDEICHLQSSFLSAEIQKV